MYLSSIVVSEFHVKQPINDIGLRNFIVLPFNIDHGMACGLFHRDIGPRDSGDKRDVVKDDLKLIAQCSCEGISHLFTEDENTMTKYLHRLAGRVETKPVLLKDGFDESWFENGQHLLGL